jgi:hypothetical protein
MKPLCGYLKNVCRIENPDNRLLCCRLNRQVAGVRLKHAAKVFLKVIQNCDKEYKNGYKIVIRSTKMEIRTLGDAQYDLRYTGWADEYDDEVRVDLVPGMEIKYLGRVVCDRDYNVMVPDRFGGFVPKQIWKDYTVLM